MRILTISRKRKEKQLKNGNSSIKNPTTDGTDGLPATAHYFIAPFTALHFVPLLYLHCYCKLYNHILHHFQQLQFLF